MNETNDNLDNQPPDDIPTERPTIPFDAEGMPKTTPEQEEQLEEIRTIRQLGSAATDAEIETEEDEASESSEEKSADVEKEWSLKSYLEDKGFNEKQISDVRAVLTNSVENLIKDYISANGETENAATETADWLTASKVRLLLHSLKNLGLAVDQFEEAHKILVSERGKNRIEQLIKLGVEDNPDLKTLMAANRQKLLLDRLKELGRTDANKLLALAENRKMLEVDALQRLSIDRETAEEIVVLHERIKAEEDRISELGYADTARLNHAHELGISEEAINKALELHYPLDLLIRAVESEHRLLRTDLIEQGIPLPGEVIKNDEPSPKISRDETRVIDRKAARVSTLYPYPLEHPLNKSEFSFSPHSVSRSEVQYYRNLIMSKPGWLRRSLIRPGSLPVPKSLYFNPIIRPVLDLINYVYCPIGQRLLARRIFINERRAHPDEDYGIIGYGQEKRLLSLDMVRKVDKSIRRDRGILSWHRRHVNKKENRKNAVLDLAQSIADVRRDEMAFEINRFALPRDEELEFRRLNAELVRLQHATGLDEAQQQEMRNVEDRIKTYRKKHPEW